MIIYVQGFRLEKHLLITLYFLFKHSSTKPFALQNYNIFRESDKKRSLFLLPHSKNVFLRLHNNSGHTP